MAVDSFVTGASLVLPAAPGPSLAPERMQQLEQELERARSDAQDVKRRSRLLTPYLVTTPKRGIVGSSKYADRLRQQVKDAARDTSRKPVLVFGEPGLEKSNIAALVHFGARGGGTGSMVHVDCERLDASGAELFGRGDKLGLLDALGPGTLLLKNVHKAPPALLPKIVRLCAEGCYRPAMLTSAAMSYANGATGAVPIDPGFPSFDSLASFGGTGDGAEGQLQEEALPPLRCSLCRVVMTASQAVPQLEGVARTIKVPPLRLRPADVKALVRHHLQQVARKLGGQPGGAERLITLTRGALRQLEAYSWPGNIVEVALVVERAVLQASGEVSGGASAAAPSSRLGEEVFWFTQQFKDRFRLNLLASFAPLRAFLRSRVWPQGVNFGFTAYAYPLLVALLLWGPQDRLHNPGLNLFWAYWWPLVFVSYPFLGRVWCAVCPLMVTGELVQHAREGAGAELLKWPREQAERYGPPFLLSFFAAILVWEEVWDLPHSAALSGWLLLLITAGAVACSAVYERRLWCRYLCPIGGMNGLFAKMSMTEVRARQGVCSGECSTYHCYKGGCAQSPDGLESAGCPLYSHPAQQADNRNCVNCMECLKACPNGSVEFRLRWPGADLWFPGHSVSAAEVALLLMLLGAVYLHHLPDLSAQMGLDPLALGFDSISPQHIAASLAVLVVPGLTAWAADAAWRRLGSGVGAAAPRPATTAATTAAAATAPAASAAAAAVTRGSHRASGDLVAIAAADGEGEGEAAPAQPAAPFVQLAYGYVPLVWAATLGYYLPALLGEAGRVLVVTGAWLGLPNAEELPTLTAADSVVAFLQGWLLLFGAACSAFLSRKIAGQTWVTFAPQVGLLGAFTAELWHLMVR